MHLIAFSERGATLLDPAQCDLTMIEKRAWATLVTRPSYIPGVVILAYTLRKHGSKVPLIILVTDGVSQDHIDLLRAEDVPSGFLIVQRVDHLIPRQPVSIVAERFADTWTKLRVFELVEYDKLIFLDADIMVKGEMDSMFDIALPARDWLGSTHACVCNIDHDPWAPPEWNPENCPYTSQKHPEALRHGAPITRQSRSTFHLMNSGVFMFHPSSELWQRVLDFLHTSPLMPTFTFPDQNFLDEFFRYQWIALGWQWNAIKTSYYWHRNVWRDEEVRALHYIVDKPWSKRIGPDGVAGYLGRDGDTHRWWWDVYSQWEDARIKSGKKLTVEKLGRFIASP
ncbi:MAG: hypothetical protein M1816_001103 [Peltula sp. TS41687]|nr:MAG: hypothetical protein M1816_001103 [Peltula sp. TS41687]